MQVRNNHGYTVSIILGVALFLLVHASGYGQDRVSKTVHNLSASGPGSVRASSESQICIFCHAPHNTVGMRPLWNRTVPNSNYQIYRSSTLNALAGQPTGSSKLCLSCHDGTIALGHVVSRTDRIRMSGGDFIPSGLSHLGTDLSDDHPISIRYTPDLAASDAQLRHPGNVHPLVKLDKNQELQCTTCHDPHDNSNGKFLVVNNHEGRLCTSCHEMAGWTAGSHRLSGASVLSQGTGLWPYPTVSENACQCCHRAHLAGGRERLLIFDKEEDNCLVCHNGQVARHNILAEIQKSSVHDPRRYFGDHDPVETRWEAGGHVECVDCHNPHAAVGTQTRSRNSLIGSTLTGMRGVEVGGAEIQNAQYEYQICFRCHSDAPVHIPARVIRQAYSENLRLKFQPLSPSYHPLTTPVRNTDTVSLALDRKSGSLIRCTDCHNNNNGPGAGGSGPDGPHGSTNRFLLERRYTTQDGAVESSFVYAMCYKCHRRASILNNESFPMHRQHITNSRTPCSACHDPHGVSVSAAAGSDHTHLINFDTGIVQPEPSTKRLEFRDGGRFTGQCTLLCHGKVHIDARY